MKKQMSFIFAFLLTSIMLLTSCNTETPRTLSQPTVTATATNTTNPTDTVNTLINPTVIPTTTPTPTSETAFYPNERTKTKKITTPHDFEITVTADKELYKVSTDIEIVVTVQNIGEDYIVPEGDVFEAVKLYHGKDSPTFWAKKFDNSYEFENGNIFKKGETIIQKFNFSVKKDVDTDAERDNMRYNFEFTLFGKNLSFFNTVYFFHDPDFTLDEIREISEKYMHEVYKIENLESYTFSIHTSYGLHKDCYLIDYTYTIGSYSVYEYYEIVFNYKTGEIIESYEPIWSIDYRDFNVTDEMISKAEATLLDKVNEYRIGKGYKPLTMDNSYFYIFSDGENNEELCLGCELIIDEPDPNDPYMDHFHVMFSEVICKNSVDN